MSFLQLNRPTASVAPTELLSNADEDGADLPPLPEQPPMFPLHPASNLLAYSSAARLPQLPPNLEYHLQHRIGSFVMPLNPTTSFARLPNVSLRSSRTRLTATPKKGERALAQIERIELTELFDAVWNHTLSHITDSTPDYPRMFHRCPEMFGVERAPSPEPPGSDCEYQSCFPDDEVDEVYPTENIPDLTLPFTLPAEGFAIKGTIPEFKPELDDSPWKATTTRRADPIAKPRAAFNVPSMSSNIASSSTAKPLRDLSSQGRLQRMGSGLAGMPLEFKESLQDVLNTEPSSSSSSRASSVESTDGLAQLFHVLKTTLLPTASSIVKVTIPIRASAWDWYIPDVISDSVAEGPPKAPTAPTKSATFSDIFDQDSAMRGWEARIWGSSYKADTMLLAFQPPWHMPVQTFDDFTQSQEFTDGARGEDGFLNYEKLWATLYDTCSSRKIRYFSVCSYNHLAVGCFSQDYKIGYISPPISTRRDVTRGIRTPNFLQVLVFWMLSSMQCEDGWTINEPMIMVPLESHIRSQQLDPLANDPDIKRAPTPPLYLSGLQRIRLERTTGKVEVVPFDWGRANSGPSIDKGKGRADATDEELEVEQYLESQIDGEAGGMDVDGALASPMSHPGSPPMVLSPHLSHVNDNSNPEDDAQYLTLYRSTSAVDGIRTASDTLAGASTSAGCSSQFKDTSRPIKALPKTPSSQRKLSATSTKVGMGAVPLLPFGKLDAILEGNHHTGGDWEVNLAAGDADGDMMMDGNEASSSTKPFLSSPVDRPRKRTRASANATAPPVCEIPEEVEDAEAESRPAKRNKPYVPPTDRQTRTQTKKQTGPKTRSGTKRK